MNDVIRSVKPLIAGAVVVAAGIVGLIVGALPNSVAAGAKPTAIVISGAYVRAPASPNTTAAYMTIFNTTGTPDMLMSVASGAGSSTSLHSEQGMSMVAMPEGLTIPAHGSAALTPAHDHVMIEGLYPGLAAGQTVNLQLQFDNAGTVVVTAPVIGITATPPAVVAPK